MSINSCKNLFVRKIPEYRVSGRKIPKIWLETNFTCPVKGPGFMVLPKKKDKTDAVVCINIKSVTIATRFSRSLNFLLRNRPYKDKRIQRA